MHFSKQNDPSEVRQELANMIPIYDQIRDCIEGQHKIKKERTKYLPRPNPGDTSEANRIRYQEYLDRAVFYNVTGETNEGFQGQLQLKPPEIKLPKLLQPLILNADGQGLSLAQIIKDCSGHIVPYGRGGWLTDFPAVGRSISQAELENGDFLPTVRFVPPWDIVNWEEKFVRNKKIVTMVVVREQMEEREKDSLKILHYERYRVMILHGENYDCAKTYLVTVNKPTAEQRRSNEFGNEKVYLTREYPCLDQSGRPMKKLPFEFIGSDNNDASIDVPPLYTMSVLNIAHYRNSADYEESVYVNGQPTPWATGLTEKWAREILADKFRMGSRGMIPLPEGANVGLLQAQANTLAEQAMINKEKQMLMAGAKLVKENSTVERKEAEIHAEGAAQTSKLSKIATNIETALENVLRTAYSFVSKEEAGEDELKISINKIFNIGSKSSEDVRMINDLINSDDPVISKTEARSFYRLAGIAEQDDQTAFAEIDETIKARTERAKAMQPKLPVAEKSDGDR